MLEDWIRRRIPFFPLPLKEPLAAINEKALRGQTRKAIANVTGSPITTGKELVQRQG
jgi:hypothetical protein